MDNTLIDTYGVWLSDRLLSGNLAQYIVAIYVLVAGIQFSMYVVDEYTEEDAKTYIHNITSNFFQPQNNDNNVESFLSTFTANAATYITNDADCSTATIFTPEEVDILCNVTDGIYECQEGRSQDILCTFALAASDNQTLYDIEHELALLSAAGFNVTGLETAAEGAIDRAADSSIDSLFPSSEYM